MSWSLENFAYGDSPTPEAVADPLRDVLGRGPEFDVSVYELSIAYDIRQGVVRTILAYLELDGVLEPTGISFAETKVRPTRSLEAILRCHEPWAATMLRRIFAQARRGRTRYTLNVGRAAEVVGLRRERVSGLLADLELEGDVEIQVSGVQKGYRLVNDSPDLAELAEALVARSREGARRGVERVWLVMEFAEATGCLTRRLLAYFGEELGEECGFCSGCPGRGPGPLPPPVRREWGRAERELVACVRAEEHAELEHPRPLARFLCGLSSPAAAWAGLTRHPRFGALADVSFGRVLSLASGRAPRNLSPAR